MRTNTQHSPLRAYRLVLLSGILIAVAVPGVASAHEKWFVPDPGLYPVRWELIFSLPVAVSLGVALLALGGLVLLRRLVGDQYFPNPPWLRPVNPSIQAVVGIQTAISLVYMTVRSWLLAPTLEVPYEQELWALLLLAIQLFVSFTFVTGWLTRLGGALLIGLVLAVFVLFPFYVAAEQMLFIGIGLFFLIEGRGLFRPVGERMARIVAFTSRYSHMALPALRIFMGLSILWLAFSEKLLNPDLGLAFLRTRPEFNFMRLLGFTWYSDELFLYSAAVVEATVGVLLIAGVLPRLVILFMWVPFNIGIPILPPDELLGHLPILAVMYAVFLGQPKGHVEGEPILEGEKPPDLIPARSR